MVLLLPKTTTSPNRLAPLTYRSQTIPNEFKLSNSPKREKSRPAYNHYACFAEPHSPRNPRPPRRSPRRPANPTRPRRQISNARLLGLLSAVLQAVSGAQSRVHVFGVHCEGGT
jgi:hypothetical protein